jgi:hypothetical protein
LPRDAAPALPEGVVAAEVFRFAAVCAEGACKHFVGRRCRLAAKVAANLKPVVSAPPRCAIRPSCRWWNQEGIAACLRCPQIVTEMCGPSDVFCRTANPAVE